jgi:cytochrome d ubiquinol oxidase subunit II
LAIAVSFYRYMVPFSITIPQAGALSESVVFLFWGAGVFMLEGLASEKAF